MEPWEAVESISWDEIRSIVWSRLGRLAYSADDALLFFVEICEALPHKMDRVRTLNLSQLSTSFSVPDKLGHRALSALVRLVKAGYFNKLQTLDLSGNSNIGNDLVEALGTIFQSGHWKQLQELRLSGMSLDGGVVNTLAGYAASGYLSKLVSLDLSGNYSISDESASALADTFAAGHLIKLVSLDLSSNDIGHTGTSALANSFASGQCSNMVSLNLSRNKLGNVGATALAKSLTSGGLSNLQALNLKGCNIGNAGVRAFAEPFSSGSCSRLNSLDLSRNDIGEAGAMALWQSFKSGRLSDLQTLSLRDTELYDRGVVALARSFKSGHLRKLESFDLPNNYIGVLGAKSLGEAIASGHLSNMRTLALSGNKLQDEEVANLVTSFGGGHLSKMESLDLSETRMGWEGASKLAQSFQSGGAKNLRCLNLSNNRIGDGGVEALASSFQSGNLSKLERLYLSDNKIGRRGAEALALAFGSTQLSELTVLDLSWNRMVDEGIQPTKRVLQSDYAEESLPQDLDFEQTGATALMRSFQSGRWKKLKTLDLSWTGIDDVGVEALAEAIARGFLSALQHLDFSGVRVGRNVMLSLLQAYGHGEWQECELSSERDWTDLRLSKIMAFPPLGYTSGELITSRTLRIPVDLGEWIAVNLRFLASTILGRLQVLHTSVFGTETALALAEPIRAGQWTRLRALTIQLQRAIGRRISNESVEALMNAFQSPDVSELEYIRLCNVGESKAHDLIIEEMTRAFDAGTPQNLKVLQLFDIASDANSISEEGKQTLVNWYRKNPYLVVRICAEELESESGLLGDIGAVRRSNEERVTRLRELEGEPDVSGIHGKVFLCGNEGVGKTTLRISLAKKRGQNKRWDLRCLQGCAIGRSKRKSALSPTRGIEVSNIEGSGSSATQPLVLALWDLAGQHEYQVLHSAFLPDIALAGGQATFFVLVCSTDKTQDISCKSVLYWLRFLSSNSVEDVQDGERRRRVFVVLNCFHGDRSDHNEEDWKVFLGQCRSKFHRFLNLHGDPFIFDATDANQVHTLKEALLIEADRLLQERKMPQICFTIQENCKKWIQFERRRGEEGYYPVLTWADFSSQIGRNWFSDAKLTAAAQYLHEAGHLILFGVEEASTSTIRPGAQKSLLIVDPTWFCQSVIGHLLLPERLMTNADKFQKMWKNLDENNSLPISTFQTWNFLVPREKLQEVVILMSRLGLCYQLESSRESVFIPALIQSNDAPGWYSDWDNKFDQQTWVMGYSLVVKDLLATLLPVAVLRKLQVDLAQEESIGCRPDSSYSAGKFCIAFNCERMRILIEYPFNSEGGHSTEDRIDVLVKPMDSDRSHYSSNRADQTNFAHKIVNRIISITRDCCPGVELQRRIIKPWAVSSGWVPLEGRDILISVETLKSRVATRKFGMMDWQEPLVNVEDLLSEEDLGGYKDSLIDKYFRTEEAAKSLALDDLSNEANAEGPQNPDVLIVWKEVRALRKTHEENMSVIKRGIQEIGGGITEIRNAQESVNRHLLNLERFSLEGEEVKRTVPRFIYLKEAGTGQKWWIKLRENASKRMTLHFLCEAHWGSHKLHEVEAKDQKGVPVERPEQWVKRLLPALDWTIRLTFVAAKIAGNVILPGLGLALSDLPETAVNRAIQMANGIPDLWKYISDTFEVGSVQHPTGHHDQFLADSLHAESSSGKEAQYLNRSFELRGEARAAVRKMYNKLEEKQKREQVGLTPVWFDDDRYVVWVCNGCLKKYGGKAHELPL